jgi:site-specific recombinase XerD
MLRDILIHHKAQQSQYAASLGSMWQDNGVVCPNTTGGLMDKAAPNKAVKRIIGARKELPQTLHAHSLRHSFVSLLISNGCDLITVAALAGDTIEIISKHYAHSFAERRAAAMDVIGASFAQLGVGNTSAIDSFIVEIA